MELLYDEAIRRRSLSPTLDGTQGSRATCSGCHSRRSYHNDRFKKFTSRVYSYSGSGNGYKVRLLEAFLGFELQHVELGFLADEQHKSEFLEINPGGEMPCLVDGDKVVADSSSVLTWLAG